MHLIHSSSYLNWTWYHFVRHVTNGGGVVHIRASCTDMFLEPVLKRNCGRDLLLLKVMNQIGQGIRKIVVKVEIVEMMTTNPHKM